MAGNKLTIISGIQLQRSSPRRRWCARDGRWPIDTIVLAPSAHHAA
jgi:hypothetical protein